MMGDLTIRFLIGGAVVSMFAVAGDLFKPKTFAGIFGAAPSVALASLALAYETQGDRYAALEGRSMVAGGVALLCYSLSSAWVVRVAALSPWAGTVLLWIQWLAVAMAIRWFALPET